MLSFGFYFVTLWYLFCLFFVVGLVFVFMLCVYFILCFVLHLCRVRGVGVVGLGWIHGVAAYLCICITCCFGLGCSCGGFCIRFVCYPICFGGLVLS